MAVTVFRYALSTLSPPTCDVGTLSQPTEANIADGGSSCTACTARSSAPVVRAWLAAHASAACDASDMSRPPQSHSLPISNPLFELVIDHRGDGVGAMLPKCLCRNVQGPFAETTGGIKLLPQEASSTTDSPRASRLSARLSSSPYIRSRRAAIAGLALAQ